MYIPTGKISEANKYAMPSVEDYLGARCLLLNNIFVGLTLGHEAVEKLLKATLILEDLKFPPACHDIQKLAGLLIAKDLSEYAFLKDNSEFLTRLDKHYGWRYYDGDPQKRSQSKSPDDLHPIDVLYIFLYENYMDLAPVEFRFRDYLTSYLFEPNIKKHTTWSRWLFTNNRVLRGKIADWEKGFESVQGASV